MKIDYNLIAESEEFYKHFRQGFEYIDVPIWVRLGAVKATLPPFRDAFRIDEIGWLVGSAEQGFLDLILDNENKIKYDQLYQSTTPCFRNEDEDELHQKWFIKNELFLLVKESNPSVTLDYFIEVAQKNFSRYLNTDVIYIGGTDNQYDIVSKNYNIELGSYGIREFSLGNLNLKWVYGTGCAEPRLSYALEKE